MTVVNLYAAIGEWSPGTPFVVRESPESLEFLSIELWETFELGRALAAWAGVATAAGWWSVTVEPESTELVEEPAEEPADLGDVVEPSTREPQPLSEEQQRHAVGELQKVVSWGEREGSAAYERAREQVVRAAGSEAAAVPLIEAATKRAMAIVKAKSNFETFLKTRDPESKEVLDELRQLKRMFWEASSAFRKAHEWRRSQVAKTQAQHESRREKRPLSSVQPRPDVPHQVERLEPAVSWTIYIDETGKFQGPNERSMIVGLFVPHGIVLPPLPGNWHATNCLPHELDTVVQRVVDLPVGILSVRADAESWIGLDPWLGTLLAFIEAAIRLLPIPSEERSRVEFLIEQRGDVRPDGEADDRPLRAAMVQLRRELKKRHPLREAAFEVAAKVVTKNTPLLGYADTIACTLGSSTPEAKARVTQGGLSHFSIGASSSELVALLDDAAKAETVQDPTRWRLALSLGEAAPLVVSDALGRLTTRVRDGVISMAPFVMAVQAHLDSKAVDRQALARELAWLAAARGTGPLPGLFALELAMASQETLNHRGAFDDDIAGELSRSALALVDEFPDRACQADLILAVSETNRFRFDVAEQRLLPWLKHPVAVPGLRHHARVWSSVGQHAAFRGDSSVALKRFDVALAHFEGLSDPRESRLERSHTACYRFIAAMDDAGLEDDDVHGALHDYASLLLPELDRQNLIRQVVGAVLDESGYRLVYLHHVLLRYLWERGTSGERAAYLDRRTDWNEGFGHPWQLIEGYRALLLSDTPLAAETGQEHAWRCEELSVVASAGPTLGYIGLAFADVLNAAGYTVRFEVDHYRTRHQSLRQSLPDAPWAAWEDLHEQSPRERLRRLLPFNFR